jgi:tRNA 5-methylaminomethyl-2-thiouridine biosynthesis bifunctional protein
VSWRLHWAGRSRFVVFDSDYGSGAAFRALLDAWRADPQRPARLHYIARAAGPLPGFRRVLQAEPGVTLDLLCAPLGQALEQLNARLDAICLHDAGAAGTGFVRALARLAAPGALLAGSGLTPAQTQALATAGFAARPTAQEGRLDARFERRKPLPPAPPPAQRRAIVVGAGLAGSAACERLCARGWQVTLVERHAQAAGEASGNRAGIFMPLLSKDDSIMARLSRAAFQYALAYWEQLGGVGNAIEGARCGVLQLARDAAHAQVQRAIAAAWNYPPEFARWLEPDAARALLAAHAPDGAWLFPQGGWARPASVCAAMLAACGARLETRFGTGSVTLEHQGGEWRVLDANGVPVAQAPVLILANGTGATALPQASNLPLAAVRGQVTHLAADAVPGLPFVLCREAYQTPAANGVVSAGATYDADGDPGLRWSSQLDNLERMRALRADPGLGLDAPLRGRVGFRCVAPDRLPLVGALPQYSAGGRLERLRDMPRQPGLYALLGYASRGLTWAPLAAELLAAQLEGEPLPLETVLAGALDPARFLLRERRRELSLKSDQDRGGPLSPPRERV